MQSHSPTITEELIHKIKVLNDTLDIAEKKIAELKNQQNEQNSVANVS